MTTKTRRRKTRSPLHGASVQNIADIRALIRARLDWEKALDTPGQYLHADEPIDALMRLGYGAIDRIRDRSLQRWQRADHFTRSRAAWEDQHMQRYDRRAWETKQLRTEVAALRARLDEVAH